MRRRLPRLQRHELVEQRAPGLGRERAVEVARESVHPRAAVVAARDEHRRPRHEQPGLGEHHPALRRRSRPPGVVRRGRAPDLVDLAIGREKPCGVRRLDDERSTLLVEVERQCGPREVAHRQAAAAQDTRRGARPRLEQVLHHADEGERLLPRGAVDQLGSAIAVLHRRRLGAQPAHEHAAAQWQGDLARDDHGVGPGRLEQVVREQPLDRGPGGLDVDRSLRALDASDRRPPHEPLERRAGLHGCVLQHLQHERRVLRRRARRRVGTRPSTGRARPGRCRGPRAPGGRGAGRRPRPTAARASAAGRPRHGRAARRPRGGRRAGRRTTPGPARPPSAVTTWSANSVEAVEGARGRRAGRGPGREGTRGRPAPGARGPGGRRAARRGRRRCSPAGRSASERGARRRPPGGRRRCRCVSWPSARIYASGVSAGRTGARPRARRVGPVTVIGFDLDMTLVDSADAIVDSVAARLRPLRRLHRRGRGARRRRSPARAGLPRLHPGRAVRRRARGLPRALPLPRPRDADGAARRPRGAPRHGRATASASW